MIQQGPATVIVLLKSKCHNYDYYIFAVVQDEVYKQLGKLAAMSLVHGGAPIKVFTPSVYKVLCGRKASDIIVDVDEVADEELQLLLKEVAKI